MAVEPISTLVIGLGGSGAWTAVHVKKQLLDAYGRSVPRNVGLAVLDTAANAVARVGNVELSPQEYSHIGGESHEIVNRVANTKEYPHISSWLLADYYLQNLPKAVFMLDQGAGQFRQFGRLALFRDVMTVAQSAVANLLERKLVNIARMSARGNPAISVVVVGSLTGGTGAGLFLDIPHLVRQVAQTQGIDIIVRAFLFLPDAFKRTLNPADLEPAKPRAFAAMRELNRFILNQDYKYGYPMYYHGERSGVNQTLWRSKLSSKLYDFAYLIDGEGGAEVAARDFKNGAAAAVADAIVSYIDGYYGNVLEQYNANIQAKISLRQDEVGRKAFVGTIGSYSIILPIQQLIEHWSYELGREIVGSLVPGERYDDRDHVIGLSYNQNPERGETSPYEEVERLMTSGTALVDPHDEEGSTRIQPTSLWRPLFNIHREREEGERRLVQKLDSTYNLDDWMGMLVPQALETDPATRRVIAETRSILEETIFDYTVPSDQRKPKGNPGVDHTDIAKNASRYVVRQLGDVGRSGAREGGRYEEALERFVDYQLNRFREYLSAYIMSTLNGYENRDVTLAKVGKLGWLLAVMNEWQQLFASVRELFEMLRQGLSPDATERRRANMEDDLSTSLKQMKDEADKTSVFGKSPAIKAQEAFLAQVEEYVEFHRAQLARDAISVTALKIKNLLESTITELERWAGIMATETGSLYTELLDGGRRVTVERQRAETIANHWVIEDQDWERERFLQYVDTTNARRKFYNAWQWRTEIIQDQRGQFTIGVSSELGGQTLRSDMKGRWNEENLDVVLNFTRQIFDDATERESVLAYLMDYSGNMGNFMDGRELGSWLKNRTGYLLAMGENQLTKGRIPTNVLLAYHDDTKTGQQSYLRQVMGSLAELDDPENEDSVLHRVEQSTDRFRLTLLSAAELVGLEGIQAYQNYRADYMRLPFDARQRTHIFPAEVRVVEYEEMLSSRLKQAKRLVEDRVALLMEKQTQFIEFLLLYAHGIIFKARNNNDDNRTTFLWLVKSPPVNERSREDMEYWWLTEPSDNPSLLEAMITYCILEKDIRSFRPDATMDRPIPYDHILGFLKKERLEITSNRIGEDNVGLDVPKLRQILEEAFMPPVDENGNEILDNWTDQDEDAFLEIAAEIVRYDILNALVERLRQDIPRLQADVKTAEGQVDSGRSYNHLTQTREEFDMYSLAVVGLEKEMDQIYAYIKNRYEEKRKRMGY